MRPIQDTVLCYVIDASRLEGSDDPYTGRPRPERPRAERSLGRQPGPCVSARRTRVEPGHDGIVVIAIAAAAATIGRDDATVRAFAPTVASARTRPDVGGALRVDADVAVLRWDRLGRGEDTGKGQEQPDRKGQRVTHYDPPREVVDGLVPPTGEQTIAVPGGVNRRWRGQPSSSSSHSIGANAPTGPGKTTGLSKPSSETLATPKM